MIRKYSLILNFLLPLFIGIIFLYGYREHIRPSTDIGLGEGTSSYTPFFENYPIHLQNPVYADSMKAGWIQRGKKDITLWIGNSQLHGVNQYMPGKINCIAYLFNRLKPQNREVLGVSFPNANIQEFLVSAIYFSKLIPAKRILMPIFYDDMREDGIRDLLKTRAIEDSISKDSTYFLQLENIMNLYKHSETNLDPAPDDFSGIKETTQDISERYLNGLFEKKWSLWKSRPDIRGNFYNDLYNARNALLGINASSVRKMIPGRYTENYNALLAIIKYCRDAEIDLLLYIPPIRHDVPLPYDLKGYGIFKKDIEQLCISNNIRFMNLENLVPGRYWGMASKTSIDFMHFQDTGHHLIADTMFETLVKFQR